MMLSAEQMRAVMHGRGKEVEWSIIDRPVGRNALVPDWCKDAAVTWLDDYSNPPDVRLKVDCEARRWDNKRYRKEGDAYRAYQEDGRMEQYSHASPLRMDKVRRWRSPDGTLRSYAPTSEIGTYNKDTRQFDNPTGGWVEVEKLCTAQQDGFGGQNYDITLEDGTEVVLRGPWHTSPPAGYTEVAYVYPGAEWRGKPRRPYPWFKMTGMGGLNIRNDVFIAIVSRFLPHLEFARVRENGFENIQPLKPEWDAPKCVIRNREWEARRLAKAGAA